MSGATDTLTLEACIGALVSATWGSLTTASVTGVASAGAVRSTVFVTLTDVDSPDTETAAVAQVSSATSALEKAMTVEDEAALITLARHAGLAVADVLAANANAPELGVPILVCRRLDGETIPRRVLRLLDASPGAGEALAAECGTALARLHGVEESRVPSRVERLAPENPAVAYAQSLRDWLDGLEQQYPVLRYGINWLAEHPPDPPPKPALVHADFRNGNLIVGEPTGDSGWLRAVLDWEVAHVGDPMEDLAYLCLRTWRFGNDELLVGGFGSVRSLRSAYERNGGTWRDDAFDWWTIARTVWWGIGLASQAAAFIRGDTTSIVYAASGRRVVELEYDLLNLIGETHGL